LARNKKISRRMVWDGFSLMHEEIWLPPIIECANEMPDERDVIRSHGPSPERHCRLIGSAVSLLVVTLDAGTHKVLPRILSTPGNRLHMINRQRQIRPAAVLTLMCIAAQDVLSRKDDLLVRHPDLSASFASINSAFPRYSNTMAFLTLTMLIGS
jgi:hypothetical protein